MKTLAPFLLFLLTLPASAQKNFQLTEKSVVKDSTGKICPSAVWSALYMKGDYDIKAENPEDIHTAFVLVRLSEKEKEARFAQMPKPKESDFFKTGQQLDLFNAKDIQGNELKQKEAKGKIIVINFWFINCGPCRREIPDLNELADQYKNNDRVVFVAVGLDPKESVKTFLEKTPFHYTLVDEGRTIAGRYGIRFYPTHVIIDTEGKVYFHTSGLAMNTVYWLKRSVRELLQKAPKEVAAH